MSDESLSNLLPTPEAVRCGLCLDATLQVRWMVEEFGFEGQLREDELIRELRRERDQTLLGRLQELLPIEDLANASRDRGIDIGAICSQHPFVYAMWVARGADAFVRLNEVFEKSLKQEPMD